MELLLVSGVEVNAINGKDKTPVYLAVKFEKLKLVGSEEHIALAKTLLDRGASPSCRNNDGSMALHVAVQDKDESLARLINVKHCFYVSPLAVAMLIDHGANINHKDAQGRMALMLVINQQNYATMQHLIEHGSLINERDCHDNTALHMLLANLHAKKMSNTCWSEAPMSTSRIATDTRPLLTR
ncbi:uncharacterized protein LOC131664077 [Phymastichus coffea]|uniref:uncharacterized protein LOC131664077 n=1 Tax=Phymastichus coffea TaxID=108790 RepID=UPI00273B4A7D|nr:uncharacterized protein LOC131664077 [Phymastichus coffea]